MTTLQTIKRVQVLKKRQSKVRNLNLIVGYNCRTSPTSRTASILRITDAELDVLTEKIQNRASEINIEIKKDIEKGKLKKAEKRFAELNQILKFWEA